MVHSFDGVSMVNRWAIYGELTMDEKQKNRVSPPVRDDETLSFICREGIYFFFATFFGAALTGAGFAGSAGFSGSKPSMPMSSTLKISIE